MLLLFQKVISYIFILANTHPAALTACNETGQLYYEGQLVLQVAVNRSKANNTELNFELSRPYQFNLKPCKITTEHILIAYMAHLDYLIKVPDLIKSNQIRNYDSLWSQDSNSKSCQGMTVGDVWEYHGLRPVCISDAKHIFFSSPVSWKKDKCPPKTFRPVKHYKKIKRRC